MSISRKVFETERFEKRHAGKNHPILIYLQKHEHLAFTVKEICKAVRMKENTVRSMLRTLVKKNHVLHKAPYFTARVKRK